MTTTANMNSTSNKRVIVLFVLLLLSSVGMFGQQVKTGISVPAAQTAIVAEDDSDSNSHMELVSWFMGTKQTQVSNAGNVANTISTNNTGRKRYINCGMTPNRILSSAFLKKAINHDSTIA